MILVGATIGITQTSNFDDLFEATIRDNITISNSISKTTRSIKTKDILYWYISIVSS